MASINIPFVGEAYSMPAKQLDSQNCINWYVVKDSSGKSPISLFPCGGLVVWSDLVGKKEIRGMFEINSILYVAAGDTFYSIDKNGIPSILGTMDSSVGNVKIIPNDTQLFITNGLSAYVYQIVGANSRKKGDFFKIENASSFVGDAVFEGTGTNDLTTGGTYIGTDDRQYVVIIDGKGTQDTFKWSDDGGTTFNADQVAITGLDQVLSDGVIVTFQNQSGHTVNDKWTISVTVNSTFYVPIIPAYQDGYGIFVKQNSNIFYISAINDFSQINALDFAKSNLWPDNITAAVSIREELWLIGRHTTEIWYDVNNPYFPFEPRTNMMIRYGCVAPYSIAVAENNLFVMIGNSEDGGNVIVMMENYQPKKISNEALDRAMKDYRVDDAKAGVYQVNGHIFYWVTFPSEDVTWEIDLSTMAVHQRTSTYTNTLPSSKQKRQGQWRVNNNAYYDGKHLFGDTNSGKIFELRDDVYTEDGEYILCERTAQNINKNKHRLTYNSLWIDVEKGVGKTLESDQGHNPVIMAQTSRNEGVSWGNIKNLPLGKKGAYRTRAKWNRVGQSDGMLFRIRTTDPVYRVVTGAIAEVEDNDL